MQSPRTPGTGISGAAIKSLGGDDLHSNETCPETQRQHCAVVLLNYEADLDLCCGHSAPEMAR